MYLNKYLTGSATADGGGTLVLQEACICKEKKDEETQVILATVFTEHDKLQHDLAVEIGEWFQNVLVPMIKKSGPDSLINVCIEGLGRKGFSDRINETDYVCIILAGDSAALFKSGHTAGIYCVEELFGKPVTVPMEPGNAGIMVDIESGGAIVLADKDMTGDKFFAENIAVGISGITDEKALEKFMREIAVHEDISCKSVVGVRFC